MIEVGQRMDRGVLQVQVDAIHGVWRGGGMVGMWIATKGFFFGVKTKE